MELRSPAVLHFLGELLGCGGTATAEEEKEEEEGKEAKEEEVEEEEGKIKSSQSLDKAKEIFFFM